MKKVSVRYLTKKSHNILADEMDVGGWMDRHGERKCSLQDSNLDK